MKTIGMAAAAFLVACGASAAHGAFERGGNTKDSSADEIAKYEAVAGLPRDPSEKTVEPPKGMETAGDCPHILRQFLTHLPQLPLGPVYIAALSSGEQYITKQSPYRRVDDGADCADIERKDIRKRG